MNESVRPLRGELALLIGTLALALAFWYTVFVIPFWTFWGKMSVATVILAVISVMAYGRRRGRLFSLRARHLVIGVGSAAVLYGVFWVGKLLLIAISPSAEGAITSVYATKSEAPSWLVAFLLLVLTSPCEEIYWRGFVQRLFMSKIGKYSGLAAGSFSYAAVHIVTLNVPLVLAALVAGLVWGWIYLREESLVPGIISHSLWATFIFVVVPVA